jgi:hypothetical protein
MGFVLWVIWTKCIIWTHSEDCLVIRKFHLRIYSQRFRLVFVMETYNKLRRWNIIFVRIVVMCTMLQAGRSPVLVRLRVMDFFNWPNPFSRTMALGSTQPLTEMSTRNLPGGKGRPARRTDNHTAICELNVCKLWKPQPLTTLRSTTACIGIALTFYCCNRSPNYLKFRSKFIYFIEGIRHWQGYGQSYFCA